jgi:hypothetical protein
MAIQITNNTLLKIIVRQGTDNDRKNAFLNSGELGYTTDTQRLFVGNGGLNGGVLVGNLFKGSGPNITTFSPAEIGDLAYNNDANVLYRLKENDGSNISDWEKISTVGGISSDTTKANGGNKIENLVRVTTTEWSTLSSNTDPNTFYVVSNSNVLIN